MLYYFYIYSLVYRHSTFSACFIDTFYALCYIIFHIYPHAQRRTRGGGGVQPPNWGTFRQLQHAKFYCFVKMQIHNLALPVPNSFEKFWRHIIPKLSSTEGRDSARVVVSTRLLSQKNQFKRILAGLVTAVSRHSEDTRF